MKPRRAFSLLEVLVAAGMMLGCVVVLAHLLSIARGHAEKAEDLTLAQRLCQNRVAEIACGARPLAPAMDEPLREAPGWRCDTIVEPLEAEGLVRLRVAARQDLPASRRKPVRFELVRWLRPPRPAAERPLP